jgi:hypothetical protein
MMDVIQYIYLGHIQPPTRTNILCSFRSTWTKRESASGHRLDANWPAYLFGRTPGIFLLQVCVQANTARGSLCPPPPQINTWDIRSALAWICVDHTKCNFPHVLPWLMHGPYGLPLHMPDAVKKWQELLGRGIHKLISWNKS